MGLVTILKNSFLFIKTKNQKPKTHLIIKNYFLFLVLNNKKYNVFR